MNNSTLETKPDREQLDSLLDDLDASIFRMGRLMMSRQNDFVRDNGMTTPQFMVLKMLSCESAMRVSDVATNLGVKSPAASMLIQSLEEQGWVGRVQDADDHRVVRVSISDDGKRQVRRCEDSRREFMRRFTSDLTPEDLQSMARIIATITDAVARET